MGRESLAGTAGSRIVSRVPIVSLGSTVGEALELLLEKANTFDTLDYVYVTDREGVLRGAAPTKQVLGCVDRTVPIESIVKTEVVVANQFTEQEEIVYLALSHGIKEVPIVDEAGRILGVVPHDTILRIFNEEIHEDVLRFGGIFHRVGKEFLVIKSPISNMIRQRLPWLLVGALGGIIIASIVTLFEGVLNAMISLASFVPVMVFLSDAAGTQSETLIVRGLALEPRLSRGTYMIREFLVAIALASVCGVLVAMVAFLGWGSPALGVIVGLSMFLSMISAVLISTSLPFLFKRLEFDPAFATEQPWPCTSWPHP